jgi:hypothetical protein
MITKREVSGGKFGSPVRRKWKERRGRLSKNFGDAAHSEQRRTARYFLSLEMKYTVFIANKAVARGAGQTIDCSSAGLRFVSDRPIGVGRKLEIEVQWPMTLDDGVPLKIVFSGKSVRAENHETAIRIVGYEFRTRGLSDNPQTYRDRITHMQAAERERHRHLLTGAAAV